MATSLAAFGSAAALTGETMARCPFAIASRSVAVRDAGRIADIPDALDLERALDELYSTRPEEFVAARNALAKALRGERRRDEASTVAAIRRPTRTVWALNRLALSGDPAFGVLLDAVDRFRTADRDSFRDVVVEIRDAIADAVAAAAEGMGDARGEDWNDLQTALQAVGADADALDRLAQGRLTAVPPAGVWSFPAFRVEEGDDTVRRGPVTRRKPLLPAGRGGPPPARGAAEPDATGEPGPAVDDSLSRRRAEKALRDASDAARKAERALAGAEGEWAAAEAALAAAEDEFAEAEVELAAAQAVLERAATARGQSAETAFAAGEGLRAARALLAVAAEAERQAQQDLENVE